MRDVLRNKMALRLARSFRKHTMPRRQWIEGKILVGEPRAAWRFRTLEAAWQNVGALLPKHQRPRRGDPVVKPPRECAGMSRKHRLRVRRAASVA